MKKSRNIAAVAAWLLTHALLCVLYCNTYFKDAISGLTGFRYNACLVAFFLGAPLAYYVVGRLFNKNTDKKFYLISIFSVTGLLTVFAVVSLFVPSMFRFYCMINAPSFLYYTLFEDSAQYIAVLSVVISSLFPALFARMGIQKKGRTNNEVKPGEGEPVSPFKK